MDFSREIDKLNEQEKEQFFEYVKKTVNRLSKKKMKAQQELEHKQEDEGDNLCQQ